jgi:hypothetical protein
MVASNTILYNKHHSRIRVSPDGKMDTKDLGFDSMDPKIADGVSWLGDRVVARDDEF